MEKCADCSWPSSELAELLSPTPAQNRNQQQRSSMLGTGKTGIAALLSSVTELVVTTTADVVNANDGVTSLREAITFANSDADASVITFASGAGEAFAGDAVILLTGGELDITEDATIDGSNAGGELVVDGNGSQSVFRSNFQGFSADISITFDGLTITGAETGIDSEAEETTINATLQAS